MLELKPYREPLFGPRTFRRILVGFGLGFIAYIAAVVVLIYHNGEKIAQASGGFVLAFTRSILSLGTDIPAQPTCDRCVLLPRGSRVLLGTDTVALLWEMRPASRAAGPNGADLLIRGAFVPGGARRTPSDSGAVAVVPHRMITARDTVVLQIIPRDSVVAKDLQPRGRLFTDGPAMRAYTIFW